MFKLMIAVKSCIEHRNLGYHDVIRSTWGKDASALGIQVKFFFGGNAIQKHESDEAQLNCPDDYHGLPLKTREICRWATGKALDYIFLCDTDTFLVPELMLKSGFQIADYAGRFNGNTTTMIPNYKAVNREGQNESHLLCYPWASGGYGYFLSRKAWQAVGDSYPTSWAEDLWVGQVLGPLAKKGEIVIFDTTDQNYSEHFPAHVYKSGYNLKFKWMEGTYESRK